MMIKPGMMCSVGFDNLFFVIGFYDKKYDLIYYIVLTKKFRGIRSLTLLTCDASNLNSATRYKLL